VTLRNSDDGSRSSLRQVKKGNRSMNRRVLPAGSTWEEIRAKFRWDIPEDFNMAVACCDSWADQYPDRRALTHMDGVGRAEDWSYGQLKSASDRFASVLREAGIGPGDRVAIFLPQCPEALITHFAAWKLGAITLPLFTLFGHDALRFRLADSGARVVVTNSENIHKINEIQSDLDNLEAVFVVGGNGAQSYWDAIETAPARLEITPTHSEDPAVLIYTSGTTGDPKGALHAHRFLIGHLPSVELHHPGISGESDVGWTPADWAWIGGLMDLAMPCLYYGVPVISGRMHKFDATEAFSLIRTHGVTRLFLPPTALRMMRLADVPPDLSIRSIGSGGESLGADLLDWARDALGAPINEFYGQTECNLVLTSASETMDVRPGSMGKPVPGHEVAVINAAGQVLEPEQIGEIAIRRPDPVMFLGYWNLPEKTETKFTGDWMRTGDLGRVDDDGYFWYVSRDDDVITSAGYRIGPTEIETCLVGHRDVVMAAVVGVPDPVRTEIVKAFVVLRAGVSLEDIEAALIGRVKDRVSPHVAPRAIEAVDSLPMTATGKIMRRSLRER
jgi:acetyl-CoA synthetase